MVNVQTDAYIEHLKEELNNVQAESTKIVDEIEGLGRTYKKGEGLFIISSKSMKEYGCFLLSY